MGGRSHMPTYKVDERDVFFNVFEYLEIEELTSFEYYKENTKELYEMVLKEALKFTFNELDPLYVAGDRQECHKKDGVVITPSGYKEAYQKAAQNGFFAMALPTKYGGQGLPMLLNTAVSEYFTGANVPFMLYMGLARGAGHLIETFGNAALADLFCKKMYNGTWGGTMCLTEPQAGSAVGDLKTTATPNGDGTYTIRGSKIFISAGDHDLTENIIHLVLARVKGDPEGTKGISLFVIPKIRVNPDGSLGEDNDVHCVNVEHKMGIKASATCSLNFGEQGRCLGFLVGERCQGLKHMFQLMNEARLLCGLQGQAMAATAYENALAYAKERVQGGGNVIINYANVRRTLAQCKAWVEGMRGLIYKTAKYLDIANHHPDKGVRARAKNRADLLTPVCKAYCSDTGFRVADLALGIYGGYGYITEYPMEQYLRDIKIASIYEGTNDIQALDLLGRKLTIKNGELFREYYEDLSQFLSQHEGHKNFKDEVAMLKTAVDTVAQVAMKVAEWGMAGDRDKPMQAAVPFLEMVGHTATGHVLLEQALVAEKALNAGKDEAFYRNKLRTMRFFMTQILPHVKMRAKNILSEDVNAIEMEF